MLGAQLGDHVRSGPLFPFSAQPFLAMGFSVKVFRTYSFSSLPFNELHYSISKPKRQEENGFETGLIIKFDYPFLLQNEVIGLG